MPASAQPKLDLSQYLKMIGPVLADKWKESSHNHGYRTHIVDFYCFFIQLKKQFIENNKSEKYFQILSEIWGNFSAKEINSPTIRERTMLMRTIHLTKDPETVSFAIKRTSKAGISIASSAMVYSSQYPLPAVVSYAIKDCIEPLIAKVTNKAQLIETKEIFEGCQVSEKYHPQHKKDPRYTDEELAYYIKMIDDRISELNWSRLPVVGPMIHKALAAKISPQKPNFLSSHALNPSAPEAKLASQASASSDQAKLQAVHS